MKTSKLAVPAAVAAASVLALTLVGWLGLVALQQALRPVAWAGEFLRNPFGLTTRVAPSGPVVLQSVQKLQRLETCRYNGQVVVRGDTGGVLPGWIAGDRMLFVGQGEVVAGVDLARLRAEDVRVTGDGVELRLPPAEILHTALDNGRSEVYERHAGLFTGPDATLETRVRCEAESRIQQAAVESGVLTTAQNNAREALRQHLSLLGFRSIQFL